MLRTMNNSSWFVNPKPRKNALLRIFCFPYAGGSAATYHTWSELLPDEIEVIALQLPGRTSRIFEKPHHSMNSLVEELSSFEGDLTSKPYLLFGHSMGSLIAFELASKFQQVGLRPPEHLIASACRAPHLPRKKRGFQNCSDEELIHELYELNGTAKEILANKELMDLMIPTLRADMKIASEYVASKAPLTCPVSVFGGSDDPYVSLDELQHWSDLSTQAVEVFEIAGNHFFLESNRRLTVNRVLAIARHYF